MGIITNCEDDVREFIENVIEELGTLNNFKFKILSDLKLKKMFCVKKANATNEHLMHSHGDVIFCYVNEDIFDDVKDDNVRKLNLLNELDGIHYDSEKDKLSVEQPELLVSIGCYRKYGAEVVNALELSYMVREERKRKEKEEKEEKKAALKEKRNSK